MPQLREFHGVFLKPGVALTVTDSASPRLIRKIARRGKKLGLSLLLEIRIDRFRRLDEESVFQKIRSFQKTRLPLIATIRSRKEGGGRHLSDSQRLGLFKKILPLVQIIDLELSSTSLKALIPLAHRKGKSVILSYHNFHSTPPDPALLRLIEKARRRGADWVKIAVTPRREGEVGRLLLLTHRNRDKDLITIAMGRRGKASRLLAPLFGSRLTYSFLDRSQAPGQIPIRSFLKKLTVIARRHSQ